MIESGQIIRYTKICLVFKKKIEHIRFLQLND